jgi:sugar phosphate isomerase/epimerase
MNKSIFVNIAASDLEESTDFLIAAGYQPEIACQTTALADLDLTALARAAERLHQAGLGTTLHAPFVGFLPGSGELRAQQESKELALNSLRLAEQIRARKIIFHPSIPHNREGFNLDLWLENNLRFWPELIKKAEQIDCIICLENIYEAAPAPLLTLCKTFQSKFFQHVFDLGHWNIFGETALSEWISATADYLSHIHLHDNTGRSDDHLALGQGTVPLDQFFRQLGERRQSLTYTLENRSYQDIAISLDQLRPYLDRIQVAPNSDI